MTGVLACYPDGDGRPRSVCARARWCVCTCGACSCACACSFVYARVHSRVCVCVSMCVHACVRVCVVYVYVCARVRVSYGPPAPDALPLLPPLSLLPSSLSISPSPPASPLPLLSFSRPPLLSLSPPPSSPSRHSQATRMCMPRLSLCAPSLPHTRSLSLPLPPSPPPPFLLYPSLSPFLRALSAWACSSRRGPGRARPGT